MQEAMENARFDFLAFLNHCVVIMMFVEVPEPNAHGRNFLDIFVAEQRVTMFDVCPSVCERKLERKYVPGITYG
jgi:hypothetical protein